MSTDGNLRAKIIRNNLLAVSNLAVKSVIDRSCFDHLDDKSVEVNNFCNIVENIFYFALKGSNTQLWLMEPVKHPWQAIVKCCRRVSNNCFTTISAMTHLKTDFAKLRSWIRMALLEKRLHEYLAEIVNHRDILLSYYTPECLFLSSGAPSFINTVVGLSALDFNFDLRCNSLDYSGFTPVDYTPYLRFLQSPESVLDDLLECHNSHDRDDGDYSAEMAGCPWKSKFFSLEHKLKIAMDQKSYLEEAQHRLNCHFQQLQSERKHAITFMKQLEAVVHDLQSHLSLVHEQYKRDMFQRCGITIRLPQFPKTTRLETLPSVEEVFPHWRDEENALISELQGEEDLLNEWDDSAHAPLQMVTPINVSLRPTHQFEIGHQHYTPHSVHYRSPTPPISSQHVTTQRHPATTSSTPPPRHQKQSTSSILSRTTLNEDSIHPSASPSSSSLPAQMNYTTLEPDTSVSEVLSEVPPLDSHSSEQTPDVVRRLRYGDMEDSGYYYHLAALTDDECSSPFPSASALGQHLSNYNFTHDTDTSKNLAHMLSTAVLHKEKVEERVKCVET